MQTQLGSHAAIWVKKVSGIAVHYEICVTENYQYVIDNWREADPDPVRIKQGLMEFAEASKSENCRVQPGYVASMLDPSFEVVPKPYYNVSLPGTVYAAHYDVGNQGIAYSDTRYKNEEYQGTGWNLGWIYRNDGVDISLTTDDTEQRDVGYHVYTMETGEWLKYTVNVAQEGIYTVYSRARSAEGRDGRFSISVSADKYINPLEVETETGTLLVQVPGIQRAWGNFAAISAIYLPRGEQVLTLLVEAGGMDISWLEFVFDKVGGPDDVETVKPIVFSEGTKASTYTSMILMSIAGVLAFLLPFMSV